MKDKLFRIYSRAPGTAGCWLPGLALTLLLLCPTAPRAQEDIAGEWEIFTKDGIERKPRSRPLQVDIGLPEVVEVASAVTGTGQGKKLEKVEVVVKDGVGGKAAQGVAGEGVRGLVEDRDGNVWVGTSTGVSRFDGVGWNTFTQEDGLGGSDIRDLEKDPHGGIWVSTAGGISHFDGKGWTTYRVIAGDLFVSGNGELWAAGRVLYQFDGEEWWEHHPFKGVPLYMVDGMIDSSGVREPSAWGVTADQEGKVWVFTGSTEAPSPMYQLACFNGRNWTIYRVASMVTSGVGRMLVGQIQSLLVDQHNRLWVGGSTGLLIFDGKAQNYYGGPWFPDSPGIDVSALYQDPANGKVWVSAGDGFGYLEGTIFTGHLFNELRIAPSSFLLDRRGDLWLGRERLIKWRTSEEPTLIEERSAPPATPTLFNLLPNYPNPFNAQTQISFSLAEREDLVLKVFGPNGHTVTTLLDGEYEPGAFQVSWDGRDEQGHESASGFYFYQLVFGEQQQTRKMMLLK